MEHGVLQPGGLGWGWWGGRKEKKKKNRKTPGSVYMQAIISERRQNWHVYFLACICICDCTDSACSLHTSFVDLIKVGGKAEHSNGPIEFFRCARTPPARRARRMSSSFLPGARLIIRRRFAVIDWTCTLSAISSDLMHFLFILSIYFFHHHSTSSCFRFVFFKLYSVAKIAALRSNNISLHDKSLLCLLLRWQERNLSLS